MKKTTNISNSENFMNLHIWLTSKRNNYFKKRIIKYLQQAYSYEDSQARVIILISLRNYIEKKMSILSKSFDPSYCNDDNLILLNKNLEEIKVSYHTFDSLTATLHKMSMLVEDFKLDIYIYYEFSALLRFLYEISETDRIFKSVFKSIEQTSSLL